MEFVHINTIGFSALSRVSGISPDLAKAIISKRREYGDLIYEDVEDLPEFVLTPELDQILDFTPSMTGPPRMETEDRCRPPTRRSINYALERNKLENRARQGRGGTQALPRRRGVSTEIVGGGTRGGSNTPFQRGRGGVQSNISRGGGMASRGARPIKPEIRDAGYDDDQGYEHQTSRKLVVDQDAPAETSYYEEDQEEYGPDRQPSYEYEEGLNPEAPTRGYNHPRHSQTREQFPDNRNSDSRPRPQNQESLNPEAPTQSRGYDHPRHSQTRDQFPDNRNLDSNSDSRSRPQNQESLNPEAPTQSRGYDHPRHSQTRDQFPDNRNLDPRPRSQNQENLNPEAPTQSRGYDHPRHSQTREQFPDNRNSDSRPRPQSQEQYVPPPARNEGRYARPGNDNENYARQYNDDENYPYYPPVNMQYPPWQGFAGGPPNPGVASALVVPPAPVVIPTPVVIPVPVAIPSVAAVPVTGGDGTARPKQGMQIPKNLKYNGKTCWQAFYTKFTYCAAHCNWSTEDCKRQLCWSLTDTASEYFAMLVERNKEITFIELTEILEKRFGVQDLPETAMLLFNQCKQEPHQTLEEWSDTVLNLATTAFKNQSDGHMYAQAVIKFCQGALDKEAGVYVANSRPVSMEMALDSLKLFKHHNLAIFGTKSRKDVKMMSLAYEEEGDRTIRAVGPRPGMGVPAGLGTREDSRLSSMEGQQAGMLTQISKIENQMELILAKLDNTSVASQRRRSPSPGPRGGGCFKCGSMEHFIAGCPQGRQSGGGYQAQYNPPQYPTMVPQQGGPVNYPPPGMQVPSFVQQQQFPQPMGPQSMVQQPPLPVSHLPLAPQAIAPGLNQTPQYAPGMVPGYQYAPGSLPDPQVLPAHPQPQSGEQPTIPLYPATQSPKRRTSNRDRTGTNFQGARSDSQRREQAKVSRMALSTATLNDQGST
jgi:hypothetical protein